VIDHLRTCNLRIMPPRKGPKEVVVYPASKRKAPPFKPLRPNKTTDSSKPKVAPKPTRAKPSAGKVVPPRESIVVSESDDENDDLKSLTAGDDQEEEEVDDASMGEDLEEDPLTMKPTTQRAPVQRDLSPMAISDDEAPEALAASSAADGIMSPLRSADGSSHLVIPQPLLIRLLHEAFEDKSTQIDKHAVQVLQKYIEVFVRETIERARLEKREAAAASGDDLDEEDKNWLDLEDLEKVAPAMLCEF
jgi:histone H3/H4